MKKRLSIYLAGSIKKSHEVNESYWTEEDLHVLKNSLSEFDVAFMNPAYRSDDMTDQFSVFGRDMLQVFSSDFVFVDARHRRGLGVGAEMMWAKLNHIPVITWAPEETHYHKLNVKVLDVPVERYIHPFVESLSDCIVETLEEGAAWMKKMKSAASFSIKDIDHVKQAMEYYKSTQLSRDKPMQELLKPNLRP